MVSWLLDLPPVGVYSAIGVLAAVENVFPPIPADTAVAVGAFLSAGGRIGAWSIFLITWTANVTSAVAVYLAARRLGRPFFRGRLGSRLLRPGALRRLETLYARYGVAGIFVSRFVPAFRSVVPPFAGIADLGAVRAIVPLAAASAIWYGTITFVAATLVGNVDELLDVVGRANRTVVTVVVAGAAASAGAWLIWRRLGRRRSLP